MSKNILSKLILLFSFSSICGLVLIEFNHQIFKDKYNTRIINYSGYKLHESNHYFCKGPKDRIIINNEKEYIEHPNSEYFEYKNGQINLFSNLDEMF